MFLTRDDKALKNLEERALLNYLEIDEIKSTKLKPLQFGDFNDYINKFLEIFISSFPNCNKAFLINNLNDLDIYVSCDDASSYLGNYNESGNYISICLPEYYEADELMNTLSHELLHMASHNSKTKNNNTGFSQICSKILKDNIGYGLNEGYTEYLTTKYFSKNDESPYYHKEQVLAKKIEKLVGEETMQKSYFTGDLYSIIRSIGKYTTMEDSIKIIRNIDRLDDKNNLYSELNNRLDHLLEVKEKRTEKKRCKYER